jgi:two-component system sensor histidine kinase KdpD
LILMARGSLRIYLGAAPGVGKTYAMLNEGSRRMGRGTDVVIGYLEPHGRAHTIEQIANLEMVPRKTLTYRGSTFEEMDVDAVLARKPQVALVDELAHTNVPGSRNAKRWQDVEELLDAGITVISTLNIQHLESLNDVIERITGVTQRETIPDQVVRRAEQVELVDQTPEALRRRMAHGNIYAPEKMDAALANYFRPGNLGALRELALLWVVDQVDAALEKYREAHGITEPWETRERIVVALTGAPGTENLIRRAARMARRAHGDLLGVHVHSAEGLAGPRAEVLEQHRALLTDLGGEYHEVVGSDAAAALVGFAQVQNGTQLILGASRRSRWAELMRGSVINRVIRISGPIDIHVISHEPSDTERPLPARRRPRLSTIASRRQVAGWAVAAAGPPVLAVVLGGLRGEVGLPGVLLLYLLLTVGIAALGGTGPGLAAAVFGFALANWFFTPPFYTWTIDAAEDVLALVVFLIVAVIVSAFVSTVARRAAEAARSRQEAEILARLAATMTEADPLAALARHLRSTFGLEGIAVLRHDGMSWVTEAAAGAPVPATPDAADLVEPLTDDVVLALIGRGLSAEDQRVLSAFGAQLAAVVEQNRLRAAADEALLLGQANELRTALLQAVSHDLRTPLASIKASVSSLRQHDIHWSEREVDEFLATIEEETDRLASLVGNLLDMSRLQAGAVEPTLRPVGLEEVVPAALAGVDDGSGRIDIDVPEALPTVRADPALLERVVANLVQNALTSSPVDQRVLVTAGTINDRVDLRIIDRGKGIPVAERERVFEPFHRLDDKASGPNVGLGLAVARGFVRAMDGELLLDDTPGGGTTAIVSLATAS